MHGKHTLTLGGGLRLTRGHLESKPLTCLPHFVPGPTPMTGTVVARRVLYFYAVFRFGERFDLMGTVGVGPEARLEVRGRYR